MDVAGPDHPPEIVAALLDYDQAHVLGATIRVKVRFGDSVAAVFRKGSTTEEHTPGVLVKGDSAVVPVLGLMSDSRYALRVVAWGGGRRVEGDDLVLDTGELPPDLPRYTAGGTDPSPGYVVFAAGMYGIVIDNTGRVVWYHKFPLGPGLNFQAQPTGYVARPSPLSSETGAPWIELDPLGRVTRSFGCARGLLPRFHDLIAEADGAYWIMCDETRTMDLRAVGGRRDAAVTGTVVQHVGPAGLLFEWSSFEHFLLTDLDAPDRTGPAVNWTHGNALDLDHDGNLLVSFRSLSEITKIDTRTGAVLWRMGGAGNQFTFENSVAPAFSRQHGLRADGARGLVLLDNLGDPAGSRAERYEYDEVRHSVRLVGSYGASSGVVALLGGTTQQLPGGRTLVAYGSGGRVEEYDAAGSVVWRIEGNAGYVFRAQRIRSLYNPGLGLIR